MNYKKLLIALFWLSQMTSVFAQDQDQWFESSYTTLNEMLTNEAKYNFKKAVFSAENAYMDGKLDTIKLNQHITFLTSLCTAVTYNWKLDYNEKDKQTVSQWASVQQVMCNSTPINYNGELIHHEAFSYDFKDVFGHQNRENLFVSKLLATRKGNCHSMPYLYKILSEELGAEAHLALAPNHVYIKHKSVRDGWYNSELTSGIFPVDAWIMASGFVHIDAITNGVYMKALNNKESIALVLIDLADNYNAKFPKNNGTFILKCCETALTCYPKFANALILKAEIHKKQMEQETDKTKQQTMLTALEKEYRHIHELGYRQMPEGMYLNWLVSLKEERQKYENKKLTNFSRQK